MREKSNLRTIRVEGRLCLEPKLLKTGSGMFKIVTTETKGESQKDMYYTVFCGEGTVETIKKMGYKVGDTLIVEGDPDLTTTRDENGKYTDKFAIRNPHVSFGLKSKKNLAAFSLENFARGLDRKNPKDCRLLDAINEYLGKKPAQPAPKPQPEAQETRNISWEDLV